MYGGGESWGCGRGRPHISGAVTCPRPGLRSFPGSVLERSLYFFPGDGSTCQALRRPRTSGPLPPRGYPTLPCLNGVHSAGGRGRWWPAAHRRSRPGALPGTVSLFSFPGALTAPRASYSQMELKTCADSQTRFCLRTGSTSTACQPARLRRRRLPPGWPGAWPAGRQPKASPGPLCEHRRRLWTVGRWPAPIQKTIEGTPAGAIRLRA